MSKGRYDYTSLLPVDTPVDFGQKNPAVAKKTLWIASRLLTFLAVAYILLRLWTLRADELGLSNASIQRGYGGALLYKNRPYAQKYRSVHLVIPLTEIHSKFCPTLFSALANGYPAPHLVNYNVSKETNSKYGHLLKLVGPSDFINNAVHDHDTVIFVDAFDTTFQLPLDILMERYLKMATETVFGAEKVCWPSGKYCQDIPESTLSNKVYGSQTDSKDMPHTRPRYLNSGTAIGLAGTMGRVFSDARKLATGSVPQERLAKRSPTSDQHYFLDVFYQAKHNITLDYRSDIFQTLKNAYLLDAGWVVNPDPKTPPSWMHTLPTDSPLDLRELQLDTVSSRNRSPWKDRRLLHNKITNTIPVILHHNDPHMKRLVRDWFSYMWFGEETVYRALHKVFLQRSALEGEAGAWAGDKWIGYADLCPMGVQ